MLYVNKVQVKVSLNHSNVSLKVYNAMIYIFISIINQRITADELRELSCYSLVAFSSTECFSDFQLIVLVF